MRSRLLSIITVLAILGFCGASQATAIEVFGNSGISSNGTQIGGTSPVVTAVSQRFTFGSGNPENRLESVTLALVVDTSSLNLDKLIFAIYTNNGSNLPGTEFARFSATPVGGFLNNQAKEYTFNYASGTQALAASTDYWFVATYDFSASPAPGMNWRDSSPAAVSTQKPGYNVTWVSSAQTTVLNPSWQIRPANNNLRFSLNLVPEPSTYALGAIGTLVMGAVARRKNRKTASA